MVIDHSKWISRSETAVLLDVDKTTVERWERFEKMPYKSVNIKGTNYYKRQEMLDFKASGGIEKTGCGRPRGYVVIPDEQKERDENEDIWMIRKKQPCFEYPGASWSTQSPNNPYTITPPLIKTEGDLE